MIRLDDIFLLDNRFMILNKGGYNLHNDSLNGEWMEMLPPLLPFVEITANLQTFEATEDEPSEAQTYTISANNLFSNIGITAPQGYEISFVGTEYLPSISLMPVNGVITSRTVYVRLINNSAGTYNGVIKHRTTGFSELIAVSGSIPIPVTAIKYGFLYNWWIAEDASSKLISSAMQTEGWVMPVYQDYVDLNSYLTNANIKTKEAGSVYWESNNDGDNAVKFNARGAGRRKSDTGIFDNLKTNMLCWVSTYFSSSSARICQWNNTGNDLILNVGPNKKQGCSIRLYRSATTDEKSTKLDGDSCGYYYGNDGKIYRTVFIGENDLDNAKVWLADNLAETKWSDGSWIAGYDGGTYTPITNANWAALTTAALCAYDDDESNVLI